MEIKGSFVIPWDDNWDMVMPQDLEQVYKNVEAISKSTVSEERSLPIVSTRTSLPSTATDLLVFWDGTLSITQLRARGAFSKSICVERNTITHTVFTNGEMRVKKWQRYFSFQNGDTWLCVYNEHPSTSYYLQKDAISCSGSALKRELETAVKRSKSKVRSLDNPELYTLLSVVEFVLDLLTFSDEFSIDEMDLLKNSFVKIQHVFAEPVTSNLTLLEDLAVEVFDVLGRVSYTPGNMSAAELFQSELLRNQIISRQL